MAKKRNSELITSILYVLIGLLLAIYKTQTLNWGMTIAGIFFLVSGTLDVIKKNYAGGAVSLIIGIAILVLGWLATAIVLIVFGIMIAVKGVVALVETLRKNKPNALEVVFPALSIALGILIAFGNGADIVILIAGVLLAIDGALGIIGALKK